MKAPAGDKLRVVSDDKGGAVPARGGDGGLTLRYQTKLPKLPIPPLEDTCKRYLRALEGLQTAQEHEQTKRVVADFLKNEGPKLDAKLRKYAESRDSYIEAFWDAAYLDTTESVVLNLNPFFVLEDDPTPSRGNQMGRAVGLIMASLGFVHDLRTGQLEPDNMRGTPLDMYQYSRLFGTARIPTQDGCKMQSDDHSKHIIVMRRGQFYYFDVLDSKHRPALTERELLNNLDAICADADKLHPGQVAQGAVGVLSTENRKLWANLREKLREDESNKSCLDVVDSALFIVCLDDSTPESIDETCANMLCGTYKLDKGVQTGTCTNRWYEKLQIIIAANGTAGINFEHSGVDGHTVLRYAGDVYTELILRFAKSINSNATTLFKAKTSPWATGAGKKAAANGNWSPQEEPEELDTEPKKLDWSLTPELRTGIRFAETRLSDLICQNDIVALEFDSYGKSFITRHGFSPDAFVQMAYQAAYFSLYGRTECTYEPAMTKAFLHGRTESIRSVQPESVAFVRRFCSSDATPREKMDALRAACKRHTDLTRECSKGLGQDRILYAMAALAKHPEDGAEKLDGNGPMDEGKVTDQSVGEPVLPAIFRDQGYGTLSHSTLSTSNCGNPCLRLFGFGAVVPDGFGIGYIIKDDAISICASSKHLQTRRFLDTLKAYLLETQRLLVQLHREANAKPSTGSSIKGTAEDDDDDGLGGYGFYMESYGVLDQFMKESRRPRNRSVGTKIAMSDY